MGAERFEAEANGKDMKEAFNHAVDEAYWNYGHAGYTGTICEKDGAYLILNPMGMEAQDVKDMIEKAQGWDHKPTAWTTQKPEFVAAQALAYADSKDAFQQLVKWYGHDEAEKIVNMSDDKWDSAIAIEIRDGLRPANADRSFLFFGWASS